MHPCPSLCALLSPQMSLFSVVGEWKSGRKALFKICARPVNPVVVIMGLQAARKRGWPWRVRHIQARTFICWTIPYRRWTPGLAASYLISASALVP